MKLPLPLKTLVTATLAITGAQLAHSQVTLYGVVDLAIGNIETQPPGTPTTPITKTTGLHNGGLTPSYIGMRGSEELGSGFKAKFQLEGFFRADTGESGRFSVPAQDPMWSRSSWVGLESATYGELRMGLNTNPSWLVSISTSALGAAPQFSPTFRQQYSRLTRGTMTLDSTLPNSVYYATPNMSGVVATVVYQAAEGRADGKNIVGSLTYRAGPIYLAYAGAVIGHQPPPFAAAAKDQVLHVLGGSYDFQLAKIFAQYTLVDDDLGKFKIKTPHVGVTVPVGAGEFQLAYARARQTGAVTSTRTTTGGGYIHNLSKRTQLYAMLSNDKVPVGTANSYVLGMRHAF